MSGVIVRSSFLSNAVLYEAIVLSLGAILGSYLNTRLS